MKWRLGKVGGTGVSEAPYADCTQPTPDFGYYGGYLVAESIPHPDLANIIKAAPELLDIARVCLKGLSNGKGSIAFMIPLLSHAIAVAEGRAP